MVISKRVRRLICLILLSLLPGVCLSLILFCNAVFHDIQQQNYRNSLPNTDLSLVRIEGLTIDDNNPYICKLYPPGNDLTVDGISIPDYEAALEVLGGTHSKVQGTRPLHPYSVFLDRSNNIELRYSYDYMGKVTQVSMMRIDKRSTAAFLMQRKSIPYKEIGLPGGAGADSAYEDAVTDYGHSYGPKLFSHLDPTLLTENIIDIFHTNRFLFYLREYFYIPLYSAAWLFPLFWSVSKRRLKWILPLFVWYPFWYAFGRLTLMMQQ